MYSCVLPLNGLSYIFISRKLYSHFSSLTWFIIKTHKNGLFNTFLKSTLSYVGNSCGHIKSTSNQVCGQFLSIHLFDVQCFCTNTSCFLTYLLTAIASCSLWQTFIMFSTHNSWSWSPVLKTISGNFHQVLLLDIEIFLYLWVLIMQQRFH